MFARVLNRPVFTCFSKKIFMSATTSEMSTYWNLSIVVSCCSYENFKTKFGSIKLEFGSF